MNQQDNTLNRIIDIINKGSSGIIVIPINPSIDAIASATSLYLVLSKMGKTAGLACASPIQSDLAASDKFQPSLSTSGDNLVISFPYAEGSIDKVDYNIQGSFFNLIVAPRQGFPKLDPNQVKYSYTGGIINFIVTIDTPNLNSLGNIYLENQNQFQGKDIINIDRHLTNAFFGTANFVNKTSSSTTELIFKIIQGLNIQLDKEIASNLYAGVSSATNNFTSYSVNAETFEIASSLLKLGAVKKASMIKQPGFVQTQQPISMQQPTFQPSIQPPTQPIIQPQQPITTNQPIINNNIPVSSQFEKQAAQPTGTVEQERQHDETTTPQDWLKPKIFRGGGII